MPLSRHAQARVRVVMLRGTILAGVLALMPIVTTAQNVDAGLAAYEQGDYAAALQVWQPLAEQGNADAQVRLAVMNELGHGVLQDYAEALRWYDMAAKQNNTEAQINLGRVYQSGVGVAQDFVVAHAWFNIASALGAVEGRNLRDNVAERMTPVAVMAAQRLARDCLESGYAQCTRPAVTISETPGAPLTGAERDAFRVMIQGCWQVEAGSEAATVSVTVQFELGRDGRVQGDVRMLSNTGGSDGGILSAFDSARRAILRCQADGFPLPAEKYDQWRLVEMTFNPVQMRIR